MKLYTFLRASKATPRLAKIYTAIFCEHRCVTSIPLEPQPIMESSSDAIDPVIGFRIQVTAVNVHEMCRMKHLELVYFGIDIPSWRK